MGDTSDLKIPDEREKVKKFILSQGYSEEEFEQFLLNEKFSLQK
jgi:hypothetical protein